MSALTRSLNWRILPAALLMGAGAFALLTSASLYFKRLLFGEPVPFTSMGEWSSFLVTVAVLGGTLSSASALAASLPASSWRRAWTAACVFSTLIATVTWGHRFAAVPLPLWLLAILLTGALGGALLAPFYRWGNKFAARSTV